jgi:hypothetical protein
VPDDKLAATIKTLAVPEHGNLVVTGALPVITGGQGQQQEFFGQPEASTSWFNRLYLRVGVLANTIWRMCVFTCIGTDGSQVWEIRIP